ncbi:MAG: hypothetical protein ACOVOC_02505 [Rhabdaerophilum sp.]
MRISLSFGLCLGVALGLGGCQGQRSTGPTPAGINALQQLASGPADTGAMQAMANLTVVTFSAHGPQVSYRAADGRIWLWYPGNKEILAGEWKVLASGPECYRYGENTHNPLTGVTGSKWECTIMIPGIGPYMQERSGDVFKLANRKAVPFVTRKDRAQFEELVARLPAARTEDQQRRRETYRQKINAEKEQKLWETVGRPPAEDDSKNDTTQPDQ